MFSGSPGQSLRSTDEARAKALYLAIFEYTANNVEVPSAGRQLLEFNSGPQQVGQVGSIAAMVRHRDKLPGQRTSDDAIDFNYREACVVQRAGVFR